jgi:hypothetical protein
VHAHRVWLEVRASNDVVADGLSAIRFREQGVRPGYYRPRTASAKAPS